ncbi:excisionase family DNA-binding protein [Micrococcus luteus]|uniref:excisionase family DNA-binding protein n=1 Tax=Actinomycetes TaxID=1760 RepID=UPI001C4DE1C5|nr:excisionase family DNA-binding protein [Rhodococcus qingshengii]
MRTLEASSVPQRELDELSTLAERLPEHSHLRECLVNLRDSVVAGQDFSFVANEQQLTPSAAAKIIGVSRGHVYKLMDSNALPFVRVGNDRRTTFGDVQAFIAGQQEERQKMAARAAYPSHTREIARAEQQG